MDRRRPANGISIRRHGGLKMNVPQAIPFPLISYLSSEVI